ncbi:MAG: hypothetical protein WD276_01405 [Actinomycetota bacterium]
MTDIPRIVAVGTPQMFRHQVARALDADPDSLEWVPSVTAAEELVSEASDAVAVLVLSPEVKDEDALGFAEYVSGSSPTTAVVLVRDQSWNGMLPAAMRAGIRDVVDLTSGTEELREALNKAVSWSTSVQSVRDSKAGTRRGTVVSIFSSKGGTGKTFLTTNLATAIAHISEQDTAVVDLDLDMGDVFSYFGMEPEHPIQDLIALGEGASREQLEGAATRLGQHLWGFGAPTDPGAEQLSGGAIGKFLRAVRNSYPFTVVDATADYSDLALAAFDLSDEVCLITQLDIVGIKHLSKALETLVRIGVPKERFHVILNRADSKVGLGPEDVQRVMEVEVEAMIPSSVLVPMSLNMGKPVYVESPKSEVAMSIGRLAERIITDAGHEAKRTEFLKGEPDGGQKEGRKKFRLFGKG